MVLSQPFIPCLTTNFRPSDSNTTDIVKAIWKNTDNRKAAAKSWKQGHGIICGILALKSFPEFKVDRKFLTKAEAAAFDLTAERHMGTLLVRTSGKNRYRVADNFIPTTFVTENTNGTLPFRVSGIRVDVLRERFADSHQYGLVAHMRFDVAVQHAQAFHTITGVQS